MNEKLAYIVAGLRTARQEKGLSQRSLSMKVSVPQSHISNIEKGEVNLKASTLVDMARALDLELMLIPRPLLTIVKGLISSEHAAVDGEQTILPTYQPNED